MKITVEFSAGCRKERNTVALLRRSDSPSLYLRWYEDGKPVYTSLEHEDLEEGKDAAENAATILRKGGSPAAQPAVTLTELFAAYAAAKHRPRPAPGGTIEPAKGPKQIQKDKHWIKLALLFYHPTREVLSLEMDDVAAYVTWRREQGMSDTTIGHEIVFLKAVCEWGRKKRLSTGKRLLEFNPVEEVKRIRSASPNVPQADEGTFLAVYRYADRVDPQKLFRCYLMFAYEHGWRATAFCELRVSDLDPRPSAGFPFGRIRKSPEHDKKRKGGWRPMTPRSRKAAVLLLRRRKAIGNAPAFPAPRAGGPWQYEHANDLLHRTEAVATAELRRQGKIEADEAVVLGAFHALRRKWGSDRKGEPLVDAAHAGDWHPATLLNIYQRPDAKTTLRVTLGRGARTAG